MSQARRQLIRNIPLETNYDSFLRVYDRRLGYYFIKGHTIQIIEPGVGYVQGRV
jgi:hypothetical protein